MHARPVLAIQIALQLFFDTYLIELLHTHLWKHLRSRTIGNRWFTVTIFLLFELHFFFDSISFIFPFSCLEDGGRDPQQLVCNFAQPYISKTCEEVFKLSCKLNCRRNNKIKLFLCTRCVCV